MVFVIYFGSKMRLITVTKFADGFDLIKLKIIISRNKHVYWLDNH